MATDALSIHVAPVLAPDGLNSESRLHLVHLLAGRAARLLGQLAELEPGRVATYALPRPKRLILGVDPRALRELDVPAHFPGRLREAINSRRIAVHRGQGLFIQVAYFPTKVVWLEPNAIDLTRQPSPLQVEVEMTIRGPLWLTSTEMDSVLVGVARWPGKTTQVCCSFRSIRRSGGSWPASAPCAT